MAIRHFLIVYSLKEGKLIHLESFEGDVDRATTAYAEMEREYHDRPDNEDYEIVLVGADSLDTLQVTHSRYFGRGELVPFGG